LKYIVFILSTFWFSVTEHTHFLTLYVPSAQATVHFWFYFPHLLMFSSLRAICRGLLWSFIFYSKDLFESIGNKKWKYLAVAFIYAYWVDIIVWKVCLAENKMCYYFYKIINMSNKYLILSVNRTVSHG